QDVEAFGIARVEHRLGAPVSALLAVVSLDGVAAEMPDEGRGAEAQPHAGIEDAPAYVDIVAGRGELRVEAADLQQRRLGENHVASCEMLRDVVGGKHMAGSARRGRAARLDPSIFMRR